MRANVLHLYRHMNEVVSQTAASYTTVPEYLSATDKLNHDRGAATHKPA